MTVVDAPPPVGYTLVLPPGWAGLPLDAENCGPAVRRLVEHTFAGVPPDVPPDTLATLRRTLEGHLRATARSAQEAGGRDLYLPVERMYGVLIPASFVVAETRLAVDTQQGDVDPALLLARMVANNGAARAVEVDGAVGVRIERDGAAPEQRQLGVTTPSKHVEYILSPSALPGRWVSVTYSTLVVHDDDQGLTELFVELFDAIMTTFRWEAG